MDIEKYIDRLDQDRRDMEIRLTEERRLSEERMEKHSRELEDRLNQRLINIDQRFDRIEQKIDDLSINVYKENQETKRWMMGTFFAVVAMIVATVIGVANIVMSFG